MRLCDGQVPSPATLNNTKPLITIDKQWQNYTWAQLRVSDLIRISNGETFPAGECGQFECEGVWGLGMSNFKVVFFLSRLLSNGLFGDAQPVT